MSTRRHKKPARQAPAAPLSVRERTLEYAKELVTRSRAAQHGDFKETYGLVAQFWRTYLKGATGVDVPICAHDCAMMLALMKFGRSAGNPDRFDNYADAAGYTALAAETRADLPIERGLPF